MPRYSARLPRYPDAQVPRARPPSPRRQGAGRRRNSTSSNRAHTSRHGPPGVPARRGPRRAAAGHRRHRGRVCSSHPAARFAAARRRHCGSTDHCSASRPLCNGRHQGLAGVWVRSLPVHGNILLEAAAGPPPPLAGARRGCRGSSRWAAAGRTGRGAPGLHRRQRPAAAGRCLGAAAGRRLGAVAGRPQRRRLAAARLQREERRMGRGDRSSWHKDRGAARRRCHWCLPRSGNSQRVKAVPPSLDHHRTVPALVGRSQAALAGQRELVVVHRSSLLGVGHCTPAGGSPCVGDSWPEEDSPQQAAGKHLAAARRAGSRGRRRAVGIREMRPQAGSRGSQLGAGSRGRGAPQGPA